LDGQGPDGEAATDDGMGPDGGTNDGSGLDGETAGGTVDGIGPDGEPDDPGPFDDVSEAAAVQPAAAKARTTVRTAMARRRFMASPIGWGLSSLHS
jgi:hypothetical protein